MSQNKLQEMSTTRQNLFESLDPNLLKAHRLDEERIKTHQVRIVQALKQQKKTTSPVLGVCTTENGGVLSWEKCQAALSFETGRQFSFCLSKKSLMHWRKNHLLTCIPAAGAASRFFAPIEKFLLEVESIIPEIKMVKEDFFHQTALSIIPMGQKVCKQLFLQIKMNDEILRLSQQIFQQNDAECKKKVSQLFDFIVHSFLLQKEEDFSLSTEHFLRSYCVAVILFEKYKDLPKALVPITKEGDTFLFLKLVEQMNLFSCLGNILVVPAGTQAQFESILQGWERWSVLEQGMQLSTIRFHLDGSPVMNEAQKYSPVSAGHGELLHLFDDIAERYPQAECLHIRNVDNIIGTEPERASELSLPMEVFHHLRSCLEYIRFVSSQKSVYHSSDGQNSSGEDSLLLQIFFFLSQFLDESVQKNALEFCSVDSSTKKIVLSPEVLYKVLEHLFHWQPLSVQTGVHHNMWKKIAELVSRPLSVFGVVRREKGDVGGGPVFAQLPCGIPAKICMEMTHASDQDSKEYFSNMGKATHFNPVLVFFELRTNKDIFTGEEKIGKKVSFSQLFDDQFWILSQKNHKGIPVCYHETVLYELIGNSYKSNLVFVEVPRSLFKPHKVYFDSMGNDRKNYGFNETLVTR